MKLRHPKGFTLIEVMIVLIVMALLTIMALPRIISIMTEVKKAASHEVVAAVRSGISNNKIGSISEGAPTGTYISSITGNASANQLCGSATGGCFDQVLEAGQQVTDNRWNQTVAGTAGAYVFDKGGLAECTYTYNSSNGTFLASNVTGCL